MYTVYEHVFPNKKRYIGITSQNPERRWQRGYGYKTQYFINLAIEKYGWDNIQHNILETNLTEKEAKAKERYYISKYKTNDLKYGYNRTVGGDAHINKPVIYKNKIYDSLSSFCESENLSPRTVGSWLTEGVPMDIKYYDNGLRYLDQHSKIIRGKSFKKKIICDGMTYESLRQFCRDLNLDSGTTSKWLNGKMNMPKKWKDLGLKYVSQ